MWLDIVQICFINLSNITINDNKDYACDKSFINTKIEYSVPSYEEMIREQKEFMDSHNFYSHYQA